MRSRWSLLLVMALPYAALPFVQSNLPAKSVDFGKDVFPIFKAHCLDCHSSSSPAGGLDLSSVAGIEKGGSSGKLGSVGQPDKSVLMQRVLGQGGLPQMPMGFAPLSSDKLAILRAWVSGGAKTKSAGNARHWAYVAPVKAPLPPQDGWSTNAIDRFVYARLKKEGLKPSPPASKEQLLRRVYLDLTGLPPSVAQVEAFLADKKPDAYERVVDGLLKSPHYGEKQARLWLDLARYADSDGYEKDLRRTAYMYRDWVINAFNRNMPYDKFTVEQIAGDLLPNSTTDDLVATGFNRNTMLNLEGGVDQADAHYQVVADRVGTTATVWLGSTLGCARCHDHKYDPFSTKDFYSMAAFYGNAKIYPNGDANIGEEKWYEKQLKVISPSDAARLEVLTAKQKTLEAALKAAPTPEWIEAAPKPVAWEVLHPDALKSTDGTVLERQNDESVLAKGPLPNDDTYLVDGHTTLKTITGIKLEAIPDGSLTLKGPGRSTSGNFLLTGFHIKVNGKDYPFVEGSSSFTQQGYNADRQLSVGGYSWAIVPKNGMTHSLVMVPATPITVPANAAIEVVLEQRSAIWFQHTIGRFRLSLTDAAYPRNEVMPANVRKALEKPTAKEVVDFYTKTAPSLRAARQELGDVRDERNKINANTQTALVMEDKPTSGPLTYNVHPRGEFLNVGEVVVAGAPHNLPAMKSELPKNRLGLAKWLVDRQNPLTARVQVNRMWELLFGRGLVETSEDFGTQGSRPSHPELLDWLAVDLMEKGWDLKAMYKFIVMSNTYKQSSASTAALEARDPQNILLARGARFRLEAEGIRDTVLAASGLLNPAIGGPSVMPYQPAGVWDTPYNGDQWMKAKDGQEYRRGIYTYWKRTSPYPSFMAFDAGSREFCIVRRIRTNTPLQALAMLNDESMMEAARALASRLTSKPTATAKIQYAFESCTGRRPGPAEISRLNSLYETLVKRYQAKPKDAAKLGEDPNKAAWVMVANVLLNLDETITKS